VKGEDGLSAADVFGRFDFGLSEEQEERAARLHRDSIVIDMLFQGPVGYRAYYEQLLAAIAEEAADTPGEKYEAALTGPIRAAMRGEFAEFEETWVGSGITAGNRQAGPIPEAGFSRVQMQFDRFPWLIKALTADDIRQAKAEGLRAGYISTQNTDGIDPKLKGLQDGYDLGLRMLGLTYNMQNAVGGGCTERTDTGISNFGAKLIARCDELGIIVDTGHSGRQTTLDACELSTNPVVASHTSAGSVYLVDRAKSDEEIVAIAESGGVVGVVAVPFFLAPGSGVTIESMLDHIDYISQLVGWEHVGIGTDWPLQADKATLAAALQAMCFEMGFRPEHNIDSETNLIGFDDYRDFPNITRGLVSRGYSDDQIAGILGGNFLRVFEKVCG
jgi:membrane dipeptidase